MPFAKGAARFTCQPGSVWHNGLKIRQAEQRIKGAKKLRELWQTDEFRDSTIATRVEVFAGRRLPNWASALPEGDPRRELWFKAKQIERALLQLRDKHVPLRVRNRLYVKATTQGITSLCTI